MPQPDETIFALASASGRAGVSIIRISGPQSSHVCDHLAGGAVKPRRATLRLLKDPSTGAPIDRVLLLWFPAPRSFTGEDILEIHAHGSVAVIERLLSLLGGMENFRLAEPGEFARRAFENGKMDLTAIEGLADLINAQTEGQRIQALRQSEGVLGDLYENWRRQLLSAISLIEASIDFSDEEDISDDLCQRASGLVRELYRSICDHLEQSGRHGEQMRDGFRLVIAGAPNVGKSSLLNRLARREAAIVTAQPGTTRDIIEVNLTIGGHPVLISDTAGIRETEGLVEREGIRRAVDRLQDADLVLWLQDSLATGEDTSVLAKLLENRKDIPVWRILSKADLRSENDRKSAENCDLALSCKTGEGIELLLQRLENLLSRSEVFSGAPLITRARHRLEVEKARSALGDFLSGSVEDSELRAEDLRIAATALGRLTGRIDVEELLGQIFGEFCIGK